MGGGGQPSQASICCSRGLQAPSPVLSEAPGVSETTAESNSKWWAGCAPPKALPHALRNPSLWRGSGRLAGLSVTHGHTHPPASAHGTEAKSLPCPPEGGVCSPPPRHPYHTISILGQAFESQERVVGLHHNVTHLILVGEDRVRLHQFLWVPVGSRTLSRTSP